MARSVLMKNPQNGLMKKGYYGFSWTYFFFGWFVPLFRGELTVAALHLIFSILTGGLWQLFCCFIYNRQYTTRLITDGFRFADLPQNNMAAAVAIGTDVAITALPSA